MSDGGALSIFAPTEKYLNGTIKKTIFTQNTADNGGAFFINGNINLDFYDTNFTKNAAAQFGGAICCLNSAILNFDGATFSQNSAANDDSNNYYRDPENPCYIECSQYETSDVCVNTDVDYPSAQTSIILILTMGLGGLVAILFFDVFCIFWIRQTRNLSTNLDSYVE